MKILNLVQGSPEWLAARRKHFTASEAPIIMGASKKTSRRELLHMKAIGTEKEFSDYVLNVLFERGHEAEESARPIAEKIIGEEIYRLTGCDDAEILLASCDGLTMLHDIGWEHKVWNEIKAQYIDDGDVPPEDYWQLVHQFAVTGADKILYMVSDGTEEKCKHIWVARDEDDITTLMTGWEQFQKDLDAAKADPASVAPAAPKPEAGSIPELMPLIVQIEGEVTETNLVPYSAAVKARIESISTDLQNDQDFATAESMVKFLDAGEKEIERVKKAALAQTASIEEVFRHLDDLKAIMREKRLNLDKQVKSRKGEIRNEIAQSYMDKLLVHIGELNVGLGGGYLDAPITLADIQAAMKGKRTIDSLRDAADQEVLQAHIEATKQAEMVRSNLKLLAEAGRPELFNDERQLVLKDSAIVQAEITNRITKANEEARKREINARVAEEEAAAQARAEENAAQIRAEENARIAAQEQQRRDLDAEWDIKAPSQKPNTGAARQQDLEDLRDWLNETMDTLNSMTMRTKEGRQAADAISGSLQSFLDEAERHLEGEPQVA